MVFCGSGRGAELQLSAPWAVERGAPHWSDLIWSDGAPRWSPGIRGFFSGNSSCPLAEDQALSRHRILLLLFFSTNHSLSGVLVNWLD